MSLMDELRRLARPYEDEEEYEEDFDLEEPFVETKEERKPRGKMRVRFGFIPRHRTDIRGGADISNGKALLLFCRNPSRQKYPARIKNTSVFRFRDFRERFVVL